MRPKIRLTRKSFSAAEVDVARLKAKPTESHDTTHVSARWERSLAGEQQRREGTSAGTTQERHTGARAAYRRKTRRKSREMPQHSLSLHALPVGGDGVGVGHIPRGRRQLRLVKVAAARRKHEGNTTGERR